jgi:TnsA endonuclease N terminal/TnsA endonuclease C terminal
VKGLKTGRIHHFLSDIECKLFLFFDWQETVTDIREQFPLNREITKQIAGDLGFGHPVDRQSKAPLVMTTDVVASFRLNGKTFDRAYAVKPSSALNDGRTLEKLEIEMKYWAQRDISWSVVTERDIPEQYVKNIQWLHTETDLPCLHPEHEAKTVALLDRLQDEIGIAGSSSIGEYSKQFDVRNQLPAGTALKLVRHLLATRQLLVDMREVLGPKLSLRFVELPIRVKAQRA